MEEIIEKAANEDFRKHLSKPYCCEISQNDAENSFIRGVKWQQERSYSEEEVIDLLYKRDLYLFNRNEEVNLELPEEWFEQFKKI